MFHKCLVYCLPALQLFWSSLPHHLLRAKGAFPSFTNFQLKEKSEWKFEHQRKPRLGAIERQTREYKRKPWYNGIFANTQQLLLRHPKINYEPKKMFK